MTTATTRTPGFEIPTTGPGTEQELDELLSRPLPGVGEALAAVGGLTLGADPVATSILHASAGTPAPLDAFVVRKANKAHGLQRRIEGPDVAGRRVVAVEDTSTTGGSVLTACKALTEAGADIAAVAVIVHRSDASRQAVEQAGYRYLAAYDISELEI